MSSIHLFSSATFKQRFLTSQKQFIDLLQLIDTETKEVSEFNDWRSTIHVLEQLHRDLYEKLANSNQDDTTVDYIVNWGNSLETVHYDYTKSCNNLQDQHNHLFCASIKSIIKNLPSSSSYYTVDGLLNAPFDQLKLCKSIYENLLTSYPQPNLESTIQNINTILQSPPTMIDMTDLLSFQKLIDYNNVLDLITGTPLDYQMQPMTGTIILKNDFVLLDENNDLPALHAHLVLTSFELMICKKVESSGRYNLVYPPVAVNDVQVQPLMLDRELIGEYTLQFTMLSKLWVARAESREVRNAWSGMPLTTTAKNAISSKVPLTKVVRSMSNSNDANMLNLNHKPEYGSFYGNDDISFVDSEEEDDDDDTNSGYDIESGTTTSSNSDHRHSLVNKKSLPLIPAQPQTPKKDIIVSKDLDAPVINISLHDDDDDDDKVVQARSKQTHPIKPRGSSMRAPVPNPTFHHNPSSPTTVSKPLPRTSSMRNRPMGSNPPGTQSQASVFRVQQSYQPDSEQQSPYPQQAYLSHQNGSRMENSPHQQEHRTYQHQPHPPTKSLPQPTGATHTSASTQRIMPPTPPPHVKQSSASTSSQESASHLYDALTPGSRGSIGSSIRLTHEELATPPRSPNPYSNQPNGIRQVLFSNQRCEVFRWNDGSWYAVEGRCLLEVRQTFTNRSCIAIRIHATGELYLNAWVLPQTQIRLASPTDVSLELIMGNQQETYLVHFEQPLEATELDQILQKERSQLQNVSSSIETTQVAPVESVNGVNTRRSLTRTSSLMQSGQEPTLIPQTLKPAMQCKCKLFVQNDNSNWSSFGSVQLMVSIQIPSRRMHIQIDHDKKRGLSKIIPKHANHSSSSPPSPSASLASLPIDDNGTKAADTTSANTLVSATVYSNNVERLGSKRISFLLVDQQNRTSSMVYMVHLRDDESGNILYDYLKIQNAKNGW